MSEHKPVIAVLKGSSVSPPPAWFLRQAGRYLPEYRKLRAKVPDFLTLCNTPELAAEITLQPIRRFGLDAAIVFSDILVVPHAMGCPVRFCEGRGPLIEPVRSQAEVEVLEPERVLDGNVGLMETLSRVSRELDKRTALIGFAGGPLTIAAYMIDGSGGGFPATRCMMDNDPGLLDSLIGKLTDAVIRLLVAQIDAGAEAVQVFDSWAGLLKDDDRFTRWSIAPTGRIAAEIAAARPGVPLIGFPRGAGSRYAAFARKTGIDALQVDQDVPLTAMRDLQSICPVQGNLDPEILLAGGERMTERAGAIVHALRGGSHVFNLGHGVIKETPPGHVACLVEAVRSFEGDRG